MPRIAGVDIPLNKRIEIGLTYIYGIGRKFSKDILKEAEIDVNTHSKDLTDQEVATIRDIIENKYLV
ncbi:MAG: 30S ribosomal protein S13, partial [Candidatus Dadabacteria bacterium]|nr:30S ribosomal protein S13 [Candidatus Dadabacteria bacterium]